MTNRILFAALIAACGVGTDATDNDDPDEDSAGISSLAQESPFTFNANPFKPTNGALEYECIWPAVGANSSTAGRFLNGSVTFFSWRSVDYTGTTCAPGQLRIARWERFTIDGEHAYIMRGGGGSNADEVFGNGGIRFAHVLASQLEKETSVLTADIPGGVGAPAPCSGKLYTADPARGTAFDLGALYYKPDQPVDSGAKWDNYMDQSGYGPTHYNYLLWTWPELPDGGANHGGGQIRAVITAGQTLRRCDVAPAYLPMFRANSSRSVGRVKMVYARAHSSNGDAVYGWLAVGWQYTGGDWNYFVD
jgi:hypothetical protein